jgi:MFS transporter, SHS family, lactate transporter
VPDYGKVICIFMAAVYVYVIILTFVGPEHLGKNFDVSHDEDMAEVAGRTTTTDKPTMRERARDGSGSDQGDPEKAVARQAE